MQGNKLDDFTYYEYSRCPYEDADTLVLVHGLGLDMTVWDDVVPLLSKNYHILRYDMPGHGRSIYEFTEEVSWEFLLLQLNNLLKKLSINSFHFIGHSGGGNFGVEVAKGFNDRIHSLTLVSTPVFIPKEIGKTEIENRLTKLSQGHMDEVINPLVPRLCYPPEKEKVHRLFQMYNRISMKNYANYFQMFGGRLLSYSLECIQQIQIPMMMLIGDQDVLYPPQLQVLNMGYMKNTKFYIIPDSANIIMMDKPKEFVCFLDQFLKSVKERKNKPIYHYIYSDALRKELKTILDTGIEKSNSQYSIDIKMLEHFQLNIDGSEVQGKWNQRKAKQLLAYIALNKTATRDELFHIFWCDHDITKARNHLRVSLNHIKSIIESHTGELIENYLSIGREAVTMTAEVHIDVVDLMGFLETSKKETLTANEISNFIGELKSLPENLFPLFYDDWFNELRTKLEDQIIEACENLLDLTLLDEHAIELLRILIKYNPVEELYYEQLISLLKESGREKEVQHFTKVKSIQI